MNLNLLLGHFDALIVSRAQAILQLAVQEKLVPQDPKDESASVLLRKIAAEKKKLIAVGKQLKLFSSYHPALLNIGSTRAEPTLRLV